MSKRSSQLVRPLVRKLHGYVPGEQPKIKGLIKLNTNENPYPPSPKVLEAIKAAVDGRLRLYPNPSAEALRERLALFHGCQPENILVGNGSDELLAMATRAFVEPEPAAAGGRRIRCSEGTVQFFSPSYSLYPVLANIHGASVNSVKLPADFSLPPLEILRKSMAWDFNAALTYLTTPNAPSGRGYATAELAALCRAHRGVIILDEAYVDFARENALQLALEHPHVLVARTFSKAYSLCALRVGYLVGNAVLISALHKIRDSYNVNSLGQVAALATLEDLPYYQENFRRLITTRERLSQELTALGFEVLPSQTNFILSRPPQFTARDWLEKLRERKLLVRWFTSPDVTAFLRITIGTEAEANAFLRGCKAILKGS